MELVEALELLVEVLDVVEGAEAAAMAVGIESCIELMLIVSPYLIVCENASLYMCMSNPMAVPVLQASGTMSALGVEVSASRDAGPFCCVVLCC